MDDVETTVGIIIDVLLWQMVVQNDIFSMYVIKMILLMEQEICEKLLL